MSHTFSANHIDPIAVIDIILPTERLRSNVVNSFAWTIDNQVKAQTESLYFQMYENSREEAAPDDTAIGDYNTFVAMMNEREQREANLCEQGFQNSNGLGTLRQLLLLRQAYHDFALEYSERHITPSLTDLFLNDKVAPVTELTKEKIAIVADFQAEGDEELKASFTDMLTKRAEVQAKEAHTRRLARRDALIGMVTFIDNTNTLQDAEFYQLPIDLQKRCIESIKGSIDKAVEWMMSDRKMTTTDFMACMVEAKHAKKSIDGILAQPLFNEHVKGSVQIDHERAKKLEAALNGDKS